MNTTVRKRFKTAILASAALAAATMVAPQPAKADGTLAVILGGSALLGLIMHANQPMPQQNAYPQASSGFNYPRYAQPAPRMGVQSYPSYVPVVYASVPAVRQNAPRYHVTQPVNYSVNSPAVAPPQDVYHSSANMNYPMAPVMQQQVQQQMQPPVGQPAVQAQQMSYYPQQGAGMGMAQPQYGNNYPQY